MATIITLALLGLILVLAEMFLPGLILGLIGAALLIGAIVMGYVEYGPIEGSLIFAAIGVIAIVMLITWMKYFQKTSMGRGLTLSTKLQAGDDLPPHHELIGKFGNATTDLRPTGRAEIESQRYEVVADTGFIARGEPVSVVTVDGMRIVVRKNA